MSQRPNSTDKRPSFADVKAASLKGIDRFVPLATQRQARRRR
jgi:hypothetical protein